MLQTYLTIQCCPNIFSYKRPGTRIGTEKDVHKMQRVFDNLGYKVITYTDLKHVEILQKVKEGKYIKILTLRHRLVNSTKYTRRN